MKRQSCNHKRACIKTAIVLLAIVLTVTILSQLVTADALDVLKHSLSLWSIIALVIIINLVSFGCFIVLFFAYQWIRRDMKPPRKEDHLETE